MVQPERAGKPNRVFSLTGSRHADDGRGICRHPTGRFCVIMPMRVTIPAGTTREVEATPSNHHAQAAA